MGPRGVGLIITFSAVVKFSMLKGELYETALLFVKELLYCGFYSYHFSHLIQTFCQAKCKCKLSFKILFIQTKRKKRKKQRGEDSM